MFPMHHWIVEAFPGSLQFQLRIFVDENIILINKSNLTMYIHVLTENLFRNNMKHFYEEKDMRFRNTNQNIVLFHFHTLFIFINKVDISAFSDIHIIIQSGGNCATSPHILTLGSTNDRVAKEFRNGVGGSETLRRGDSASDRAAAFVIGAFIDPFSSRRFRPFRSWFGSLENKSFIHTL